MRSNVKTAESISFDGVIKHGHIKSSNHVVSTFSETLYLHMLLTHRIITIITFSVNNNTY